LPYDHLKIEKKWQDFWESNKTFKVTEDPDKEKFYALDMFPYPSGAGLHVGHPEGYTATDIVCRYKRMLGLNVLHPMGWDSFGLPAENYAIKTGTHPRISTEQNINNFRRQIKALGFSYDWDREIATTHPDYVKWTQWIFKKLYEKDLAYEKQMPINWCAQCKVGVANEEVRDGLHVICDQPVGKKNLRQWNLKITAYADRLLADLDDLDWPESIKEMQRNWIGRSEGAKVVFKLKGHEEEIEVFTTRPDTLFGATYMVLSPEHELVKQIATAEQKDKVEKYVTEAGFKSDLERSEVAKEKSGVFSGALAINPVNGEEIPVWVADYVLMGYGTGAIMAVPGHDTRDYEFAKQFDLNIVEVISGGDISAEAYTDTSKDSVLVNSGFLNDLPVPEAKKKIIAFLEEKKIGEKTINYKMRDWIFARQRYWGEPFPLIHKEDGSIELVPDEDLPVRLPEVESYQPSGTGESPLTNITEWVNTTAIDGSPAKRETNTMPQWAGSCWYYLRFMDARNPDAFVSPENEKYWGQVDLYIGGAEHAVLHLLYSRFWHKVLFDCGLVSHKEPYKKLVNQGMILGADGEKMSKSRGNVVNPDDVIEKHGADSLRLFEMFMGPLEKSPKPWNDEGVAGVRRFLDRVSRLIWDDEMDNLSSQIVDEENDELKRFRHKTIKAVTDDLDNLSFNTGISRLMELTNELTKAEKRPRKDIETLILLLAPYAPHLAEEAWQALGHEESLSYHRWPTYDSSLTVDDSIEIVVQVNGKIVCKIEVPSDISKDDLEQAAMENETVKESLVGMSVKKVIAVPKRLVNVVAVNEASS
jgi:leucyl-tRNA synthetase